MFEFLILFICAGSGLFFTISALVEAWASRGRDPNAADRELAEQVAAQPRAAKGWHARRSIQHVTQAFRILGSQGDRKAGYR